MPTSAWPLSCSARHSCWCPCILFLVLSLVIIPAVVFALSATFSAVLWGVECAEIQALDPRITEIETINGLVSTDDLCSYYEWFKYITGNLVGVSLTNVAPASEDVTVELLDLIISTWSLSLTGVAVGLIGGVSVVGVMVDKINGSIDMSSRMGWHTRKPPALETQTDAGGIGGRSVDGEELAKLTIVVDRLAAQQKEILQHLSQLPQTRGEGSSKVSNADRRSTSGLQLASLTPLEA